LQREAKEKKEAEEKAKKEVCYLSLSLRLHLTDLIAFLEGRKGGQRGNNYLKLHPY
jgi:hypothetical protein